MALADKHCIPCEGGVPPLEPSAADTLLGTLDAGWRREDGDESGPARITRDDAFRDFRAAMEWTNAVAAVAEGQGHHPDLLVHGYKNVRVTLYTHAIGGLSENDFILAARIDRLRELLHG